MTAPEPEATDPVAPRAQEPPNLKDRADAALQVLADYRSADAPTHGGHVLSYVYDSGLGVLDEVAASAARMVQSVNGLDPTVFGSVAAMERDLIEFGRTTFHGPDAVGSVTSGGTESCLLAVKAARDRAGAAPGQSSMVVPTTAHAAFLKAAALFGVEAIRVPVPTASTAVRANDIADAIRDDTILVVASAPNYPTGALDPIAEIAEITRSRDLAFHVDACLGGFALAWWDGLPPWDFRVDGVTSLSADLHKYGYAPKGSSLLLHRDRDRHRAQFFSITDWPGYPIVNPTLLGSRSAAGLASAWAVSRTLGADGYAALTRRIRHAFDDVVTAIDGIDGLCVVGAPSGPVLAVRTDPEASEPVDTHLWGSAVSARGFALQAQPAFTQPDGTVLPATTHLTITPVTDSVVDELVEVLALAAEEVRGAPARPAPEALRELAGAFDSGAVTLDQALALPSAAAEEVLIAAGINPHRHGGASDLDMPAIIAAVESLPRPVTARLLAEFLAAYCSP